VQVWRRSYTILTFFFNYFHNCFAVTCNNFQKRIELLKSAYCIIYYKDNYLLDYNNSFINHIKKVYGSDYYNSHTNTITVRSEDKDKNNLIEISRS
jgi:hypothetical protein